MISSESDIRSQPDGCYGEENPLLERFKFCQILCPANSLSPRVGIRWWCDDVYGTIVVLQKAGD